MSLSKVTSSKSRDLYDHHGVSSFERATLIFKEIEAFIDNELADTPIISASYEIPRMKSKRKRGPFLIKPLNKSKARKTLNDMEYDPVRMEWAGNVGALKTFAGVRPGLIANKANSYKPPTDEMIWNAKEQRWEGNWDDLRNFETRKPHLIKSIPSVALPKDRDGMSYNPITMTWDGNSDVLLAFGPISLESSTPDDGFKVGVEFQLTPATVQLFADCAARHNTNTNGWWRDEKTREHLAVIRTMSIMRLVRDVKRAAFAFEEPSYMDIASEREPPLKLKSPHAEPEVDFDDAWEDIGPFTGTVRVKLPESNTSDIDFGLEELSKFGSISNRNSKQAVADEDWDGDFAEDLGKILPRKLSTHKPIPSFTPPSNNSNNDLLITTPPLNPSVSTIPVQSNSNSNSNPVSLSSSTSSTSSSSTNGKVTQLGKGSITEKKPFALLKADAPHRKSYHDLSAARASPKVAWDEDEEDGFEISNNAPLRLKVPGSGGVLSSSSSTVASEDDVDGDFDDDDDDTTVPSEPNYPEEDEGEVVEVEDDDWNDVELPPTLTLGEPVTKRGTVQQLQQQQQYQPPEKEEWDEFEISAEKLELKLNQRKQQQQQNQQHQQHKKHHKGKAEEEELDGLEIPDGFQLRLKR